MVFLLLVIIVPLLIHADALVNTKAFWLTRPISSRTLMLSKLTFIMVFLVGIRIVIDILVFLENGVSLNYICLAIPEMLYEYLSVVVPILLLAAITPNFNRYVVSGIGLMVALTLWSYLSFSLSQLNGDLFDSIFYNPALVDSNPYNMSLYWSIDLLQLILVVFASFWLISNQFLSRHSARTIRILVFILLIHFFIGRFWTWDYLKLNALDHIKLNVAGVVNAEIDKDSVSNWETDGNHGTKPEKYKISAWDLTVTGLPTGQVAYLLKTKTPRITYPDGTTLTWHKDVTAWDDKEMFRDRYASSLFGYLKNINIINPYSRENSINRSSLLKIKTEDYEKYKDTSGVYSANSVFEIYQYQVSSVVPLRIGVQSSVGPNLFTIHDIIETSAGIELIIGEKKIKPRLDLDRKNDFNRFDYAYPSNYERSMTFDQAFYILRNKKTNQAFVPESDLTLESAPGNVFKKRVKRWSYRHENTRQYASLPKIDKAWLADAELIRIDSIYQGYFDKYLEFSNVKLAPQKKFKTEDGVRRWRFVTGEVQYEHVERGGKVFCKEFYKSGPLRKEWIDINGMAQGLAKEYYESGELLYEYSYLNDKIDGIVRKYSRDGNLISERTFKQAVEEKPE